MTLERVCDFIEGNNFLQCKEVRYFRYKRNSNSRSGNDSCHGKAVNIKYSECVSVTSVFQHTKLMRRIILLSVACPAVHYFFTFLKNVRIFRKKLVCFDFLFSKTVLII